MERNPRGREARLRPLRRSMMGIAAGLVCAASALAQDWQYRRDDSKWRLEARNIAGERLEELRVTADIPAPPALVSEVLMREALDEVPAATRRTFISRSAEAALLADRFTSAGITDRCYLMQYGKVPGADPTLRVQFATQEFARHGLPDPAGCVPMRSRGEWSLTATGQGTRVVYVSHTDPGGQLPAFLVRRSLEDAVVRNVENVAAAALRRTTGARGIHSPAQP